MAVFEQDQRGHGADAESVGHLPVLLDIDLDHFQLAGHLSSKLLEMRLEPAARRARGTPEIDQHGHSGLPDLSLESAVTGLDRESRRTWLQRRLALTTDGTGLLSALRRDAIDGLATGTDDVHNNSFCRGGTVLLGPGFQRLR